MKTEKEINVLAESYADDWGFYGDERRTAISSYKDGFAECLNQIKIENDKPVHNIVSNINKIHNSIKELVELPRSSYSFHDKKDCIELELKSLLSQLDALKQEEE